MPATEPVQPTPTPVHRFVSQVAAGVTGAFFVQASNDRTVPIMVLSAIPGAPLVICFNGAMGQAAHPYPSFALTSLGHVLAGLATLLIVSDPSLVLSTELNLAWYAGDAGLDTPEELRTIFKKLRRKLAPSRVVFASGSSGAHPALVHSREVPGSVCLLQNPLPSISGYFPGPVATYRQHCWPGREGPLADFVVDDAGSLYAGYQGNKILILQNSMDPLINAHLSPLMGALSPPPRSMLLCEYFPDAKGHMYPAKRWFDFIKAAVVAHTPSLDLVVATATQGAAEMQAEQVERGKANAHQLAALAHAEALDE